MEQNNIELSTILINKDLPKPQRMNEYIKNIKNPYFFLCNGVEVRIEFTDEDITLEELVTNFLINKK